MKYLLFVFFLILIIPSVSAWDWSGYESREIFNITNGCFGCVVNVNTSWNQSDRWVNTTDNKELAHWHDEKNTSFVYINLTANGTYNISKYVSKANTNASRSDGNTTFSFFDNFSVPNDLHQWDYVGSVSTNPQGHATVLGNNNWNQNGMKTKRGFARPIIIEFDENVSSNLVDVQYGYNTDYQANTGINFYKNGGSIEYYDYLGESAGPTRTYDTNWDLDTILVNDSLGYLWKINKTNRASYNTGTQTNFNIGITMYTGAKNFTWDNVRAYNYSSKNSTINYNRTEYAPAAPIPAASIPLPVSNCGINIIVNNTNLAPTVHPEMPGTGERTTGTLYWANESTIELFVFSHGVAVNDTAEIHLSINGTLVADTSGRPLGAAEQSNKTIIAMIPKGANYSVVFLNTHHYEWREYKLDLDISGCNYPDNNNSLNSVIQGISIGIAFLFGLIVAVVICKKCLEDHVKKYHKGK